MSKGLASFPEEQRTHIATRRLQNGIGGNRGNGFWGAKDYFLKKGMRLPGQLGTQQLISDAMERMQHGSGFSTGYIPAARDRRHQSDGPAKGEGFGQSERRKDRAPRRGSGRRDNEHWMGVRPVRNKFPRMGGGQGSPYRFSHTNKPRIVRSYA